MMRAVVGEKTRLHHRYLGHRDDDERHVREEDEITSAFFDGLALLSPLDGQAFWRELLGHEFSKTFFPDTPPVGMDWQFWPRRFRDRVIEPDMLIKFRWSDGAIRTVLVELKWKAGIGKDQLQRQWRDFLDGTERRDGVHVFVAHDIAAGLAAKTSHDVWGGNRLLLRSWMEVRNAVGHLPRISRSLGIWADLADRFLERLKISNFRGFKAIKTFMPPMLADLPIFWQERFFLSTPLLSANSLGWLRLELEQDSSIFWYPRKPHGWPPVEFGLYRFLSHPILFFNHKVKQNDGIELG